MKLFNLVIKESSYIKYRLPSISSDIYLIRWHRNSRTKIHNHNGQDCHFIILNGNLSEYIYKNENINSLKKYEELKPFKLNFINDMIGYHQIMNDNDKFIWSLHRYH